MNAKEYLAHHEAGHLVAGMIFGYADWAAIDIEEDGSGNGVTKYNICGMSAASARFIRSQGFPALAQRPCSTYRRSVMAAAGPVAEAAARWSDDPQGIEWEWLSTEDDDWSPEDEQSWERARCKQAAYREAIRLVRENWSWICRCAEVIVRDEFIHATEAESLRAAA